MCVSLCWTCPLHSSWWLDNYVDVSCCCCRRTVLGAGINIPTNSDGVTVIWATWYSKGNDKVVPVLQLSTTPWRRIGEWRYSSTHSLTLALEGGEWSASHASRFTPRERAPGTHWIGGWVGPRAVLDAVVKRKIPSPSPRELNPRTRIVQPVVQRYTDWAVTALTWYSSIR
jgi:hypothetical protein